MKKVLVTRPLPQEIIDAIAALPGGAQVAVRADTAPMAQAEMVAALGRYDVILPTLGDRFTAEVFAAQPDMRTRLLANFGVGYNHIDVEAARAHGVAVTNTPGVLTDATADLALTLILMTARRAGEGERLLRAGGWEGWHPTQLLGLHVTGKTVGIAGFGRIGQAIARRCHHGFGMQVRYWNRSQKDVDFPATRADSLTALAGQVDILVAAVPGGAETHHMIGAETFAAMAPTALFINIARGDVVDEPALIAALEAGEIAGAGLDVYEFEPAVPAALCAMENVTLLPHLGSASLETRVAMGMKAVENIAAHLVRAPLPNPV